MGLGGGGALWTISRLSQHTNQLLAHYANAAKLITAAKHTQSADHVLWGRGELAPLRIHLSFKSLARRGALITRPRHNSSPAPLQQVTLRYVQDFSQSFFFFFPCSRSLMDADCCDAFISSLPKKKKKKKNPWTQTPMVKHKRGRDILKLTRLQREWADSKGITGKRFQSLLVTCNPLLILGPHNWILTLAPLATPWSNVHWY